MLLDVISVLFCLWASGVIRPLLNGFSFIEDISPVGIVPPQLYVLFPLIWVLVFVSLSIYDGRKFVRVVDEFTALLLATFLASTAAAGILYFSFRQVSRALFLLFVAGAFFACLFWRVVARFYFRANPVSTTVARRLLVVGMGPLGQSVAQQINESNTESLLRLVGFVNDGYEGPLRASALGTLGDLEVLIREHRVTDIVIALPYSEYHKMGQIVQLLESLPVGVWIALGFFDLALYRMEIDDFAGIPMLDLRASAIDDYQRMIKRVFDLTLGLLAFIPALPVMGIAALLIYLEDGGPVLFRQKRVGEGGRLFEMIKFRTMVKNAEQLKHQVERVDENGNVIHKSREDPRVTRLGRFLRRFSVDELPQLINVLRGEMSLVGPRPEMPYLVEKYQPWQRKRFAVPPGLTGWWQVSGRSDKPMHLHTEDDLYYIQNYSIFLDIQILLKTVWVVIAGKGSY